MRCILRCTWALALATSNAAEDGEAVVLFFRHGLFERVWKSLFYGSQISKVGVCSE